VLPIPHACSLRALEHDSRILRVGPFSSLLSEDYINFQKEIPRKLSCGVSIGIERETSELQLLCSCGPISRSPRI